MKVAYLLSSVFDYSKLIAPDAGPEFAEDYGWETITFGDLNEVNADVIIVDQRHTSEELDLLLRSASCHRKVFVYRIVDPFWPFHRDHPYYRLLDSLLDHPRVHFMLTYQPSGITALYWGRCRRSRFILAPYVYNSLSELPLDHAKRFHKVALSGSIDRWVYPVRYQMNRISRLPPLRFMTDRLVHPCFSDIGTPMRHKKIGNEYLQWLSGYKFAFLCSSRSRLEFLKYREIAYAGCVPVGDLPATLLDCPRDAFFHYRRNWLAMSRDILTCSDTERFAHNWRAFLKDRRDIEKMRREVNQQLSELM